MTMGFIKRAAVATAMATAVVAMAGQGGAFAVAGGGAVGQGGFLPGLKTDGSCTPQTSVRFDSNVLMYADAGGATLTLSNIHFEGASDGCETLLGGGRGHGTLSGGLAGTVSYQRTATLVMLVGTINGQGVIAGACILVPLDVNPVERYALACVAATN